MEALGINAGNLFVNIICFAIAYLIIAKLIVKPIKKMTDNRKEVIDKGIADAKIAADLRENALQESEKILNAAREESARMLKEATDQIAQMKEDYRKSVDAEVSKELRDSREYLNKERELMLSNLRGQIIDLSISGAKKILSEELSMDEAKQHKLLNDLFTGIKDGSIPGIDRLPNNLTKMEVTTAVPLTDEERAIVEAQLSGKLAEGVVINYVVDPRILGGIIIHSGDYLIDGSVLGKAQDLKEALHKG
ncbi:MAG TPA: F0F1 ATP synthase subunit B [Flexilinea sp.]|jgi:F-type H+-transporting ATPase subunit b|nr:MAG: ATP synthase subunit b, sodium ion specific [Chloroflexi bacterium ADurb.Bin344]HOG22335.1 F0F1 ATP synthase subunit B [Flexilinea sp.]HOG60922.1 F0F1 ATP synthase subunit B [Flexilinea sp.]HOP01055.1 F0F1 ATP synthase subunit B [Flexilinea sp.]HOR56722.1 F0F1 ATP synthase subunit B [Flexilinea sp.]